MWVMPLAARVFEPRDLTYSFADLNNLVMTGFMVSSTLQNPLKRQLFMVYKDLSSL